MATNWALKNLFVGGLHYFSVCCVHVKYVLRLLSVLCLPFFTGQAEYQLQKCVIVQGKLDTPDVNISDLHILVAVPELPYIHGNLQPFCMFYQEFKILLAISRRISSKIYFDMLKTYS